MVFSSISFLIFFLPCLLITYFCVPKRLRRARNIILLLFSIVFYAYGGVKYLLLLIVSVAINYFCGLMAGNGRTNAIRRLGVVLALVMIAPEITLGDMEEMGFDLNDKDAIVPYTSSTERAVCHEIAHQWFYGVVGNDQVAEPWLDEGMCRFAEYLYQTEYPPETNDSELLETLLEETWLKHWHDWVISAGEKGNDYYAPDTTYLEKDLYYWQAEDPMGYSEIYSKGAALIYEIQQQMGEEAFDSALKEYVRRFAYGIVTTESFREFWSEKTDTARIFKLYFRES